MRRNPLLGRERLEQEIIRDSGVPLGIGSHTNTRKGMVHFGEVAKYRCGAIVFAHGLIKVTARHKDGGDSAVCELRHDVT